jgi:hypothetical protein
MGLRGAPGLIDRLAAAPLEFLQVVGHGVRDGVRTGPRVVPFLAADLGAPPCARGPLRLPIVEHGDPISVLQIIAGADFVLDVSAAIRTPPREPRAALTPASVSECKPLL